METLGIGLGLILGAVVGWFAAFRGRPGGNPAGDVELVLRVKTLEADFERLRLDFQDTLDKVHHLYDRTRKRLDSAPSINGPALEPELTGKAAIRARARLGGMLK